jgi:hypothetical protein
MAVSASGGHGVTLLWLESLRVGRTAQILHSMSPDQGASLGRASAYNSVQSFCSFVGTTRNLLSSAQAAPSNRFTRSVPGPLAFRESLFTYVLTTSKNLDMSSPVNSSELLDTTILFKGSRHGLFAFQPSLGLSASTAFTKRPEQANTGLLLSSVAMGFIIALGSLFALALAFCVTVAVRRGRDTSGVELDLDMMYDPEPAMAGDGGEWAMNELETDSGAFTISAPDSSNNLTWSNTAEEGIVAGDL